jgi:hypothetical protein
MPSEKLRHKTVVKTLPNFLKIVVTYSKLKILGQEARTAMPNQFKITFC